MGHRHPALDGHPSALGLAVVVVELLELGLLAVDIDGASLIAVQLDLVRALVMFNTFFMGPALLVERDGVS